ncbi:MAG: glycosyltransferase family 4 protein [bacterium]
MKKKKILIHSIVFSPDGVSTAYLYNDIALGLTKKCYEVIVLTTIPHYNVVESSLAKQPLVKKLLGLYYESDFNGIRVLHVPLKKYNNTIIRLLSFIYWHISSFFLGLSVNDIDYIISPSPPLSIGFVSILIAKIKKAKFIYNVQEIYPDLLIKHGGLKSKILISSLKWLEKFVYNNADAVVTIDQQFYNQIVDRFLEPKKLKIVSNFVDNTLYKPITDVIVLPEPFENNKNKIKILYAGNIGFFQDWEPILYAANILRETNIEFWIIGEGVKKDFLIEKIQKDQLFNIKIFPYQNRELIPFINSYADIHFISINKEMEQEGFPSKVYTIMASAKPLIVITGKKTPLYNFLSELNCSILVTENRNENFLKSIVELANDKCKQNELGQRGYKVICQNYTKEKVVEKYVQIFESL